MRHFLFMPALLLLFAACGEKPVGYRIDGNIAGAGDGKVILTTTDDPRGEPATCDTTVMKDGKFTFKGHTPAVRSATLTIVPDGQTAAPGHFFIENSDITVSGDWAGVVEQYGYRSLPLEVTGSRNTDFVNAYNEMAETVRRRPEHAEYARLADEYDKFQAAGDIEGQRTVRAEMDKYSGAYREAVRVEQLRIVVANPDLPVSAYYLDIMSNDMSLAELEGAFNALDENVRNSAMAAELRGEIEAKRAMQPGQPAPDFTLAQADGTPLTLSDLRGKIVIIDFWASWCGPCRAGNPAMKKFYEKYHGKGVEILGISNDTDHDAWRKAIEEDGLPWLNVVDEFPVQMRPARVISMYVAPYLPTLILIDREGKIVAHNIEKEDLEEAVGKLL